MTELKHTPYNDQQFTLIPLSPSKEQIAAAKGVSPNYQDEAILWEIYCAMWKASPKPMPHVAMKAYTLEILNALKVARVYLESVDGDNENTKKQIAEWDDLIAKAEGAK